MPKEFTNFKETTQKEQLSLSSMPVHSAFSNLPMLPLRCRSAPRCCSKPWCSRHCNRCKIRISCRRHLKTQIAGRFLSVASANSSLRKTCKKMILVHRRKFGEFLLKTSLSLFSSIRLQPKGWKLLRDAMEHALQACLIICVASVAASSSVKCAKFCH